MSYIFHRKNIYVGLAVCHPLFDQYGIGEIKEIQEQVLGRSGTEARVLFPCGREIWLKMNELRRPKGDRPYSKKWSSGQRR